MKISIKTKFFISFIIVIIIFGGLATWIGVHLISSSVVREAQKRVVSDLNSAREVYQTNEEAIKNVVRLTAVRFFIQNALINNNMKELKDVLPTIMSREDLDVLTITDKEGVVLYRVSNPELFGDNRMDALLEKVIVDKKPFYSTQIVPREELLRENEKLADKAYIELVPTPHAKPTDKQYETSGMMLKAAAPILDNDGNVIGVLYGGKLLNRNYEIVDKVKEIVYRGEKYQGKDMGTVTIFQNDLRISTNVIRDDGSRAIGTRVSQEVYEKVLGKGESWFDRAFVVNDWYISAYEPIKNIGGEIIGILYVGILESKYVDMKEKTLLIFIAIIIAGVFVSIIISYLLGNMLIKPIKCLVKVVDKMAEGDLSHRVECKSGDEIGELAIVFNMMADSIQERDEKLKEYAKQKIMESERLAMIGQLAAGVAHEINNPLGSILLYSHLILEDMEENDQARKNLEKVIEQATRSKKIVKGLLDFARQTEPEMDLYNVNDIINNVISLVEGQAAFQNIIIHLNLYPSLPEVMLDKSQIQQVFLNILLNAAEAIEGEGELSIQTEYLADQNVLSAKFTDTGCGIPEEKIDRIFEPFFTLKKEGKGTGLGLAISYGIMKKHDGSISVKSKIGEGTTFTVSFPIKENNE
ncbi:cache domain-containing protein [bacterium]|nr:cache domain-containing protein [bacterium]